MSLSLTDFQSFPKVELHRHIDGSVPADVVRKLALKQGMSEFRLRTGKTISIKDEVAFDAFYQIVDTESLDDLLSRFDVVLSLMQTPQGISDVFYECALDCAKKNIWYVEWTMAPAYHTREGLSYAEVIQSASRGMGSGWKVEGVESKLILAIPREAVERKKPEDARDPFGLGLVEVALKYQGGIIAGLGLACDEFSYPPELYKAAFEKTFSSHLGRIPHAGEMGTQRGENVRMAIEMLGATRIGHGIPVGGKGNEKLIQLVKEKNVAIEACPLSNLLTGFIFSIRELGLDTLLKENVRVSINSDDPALFRKDLADNFKAVFDAYDWGEKELAQFMANALQSACMTEEERARIYMTIMQKAGYRPSRMERYFM